MTLEPNRETNFETELQINEQSESGVESELQTNEQCETGEESELETNEQSEPVAQSELSKNELREVEVESHKEHLFWKISWPILVWIVATAYIIYLSFCDKNNTGRYLAAIYGAVSSICAAIFISYFLTNRGQRKKKKQEYIDKLMDKIIPLFVEIYGSMFERFDQSTYFTVVANNRRLKYLMEVLRKNINEQCKDAITDFLFIEENFEALNLIINADEGEKKFYVRDSDADNFHLYYERITNRFEAMRLNIW